jgi:hypothetical protein
MHISGRNQLIIMLAHTNFNFLLQGNILEVYEYDIKHSICPESENGEILTYFGISNFFFCFQFWTLPRTYSRTEKFSLLMIPLINLHFLLPELSSETSTINMRKPG